MYKKLFAALLLFLCMRGDAQTKMTSLYDFMYKLAPDSAKGEAGDWAVERPKLFPVTWKTPGVIMSDDIKINFYREGVTSLSVNGVVYQNLQNKRLQWKIMLRGPRMGFTNYALGTEASTSIRQGTTIDSLLGKQRYTFQLLKSCPGLMGFNYYQLKFPRKDPLWVKLGWLCGNAGCALKMDVYEDWSKQYAELNCGR